MVWHCYWTLVTAAVTVTGRQIPTLSASGIISARHSLFFPRIARSILLAISRPIPRHSFHSPPTRTAYNHPLMASQTTHPVAQWTATPHNTVYLNEPYPGLRNDPFMNRNEPYYNARNEPKSKRRVIIISPFRRESGDFIGEWRNGHRRAR